MAVIPHSQLSLVRKRRYLKDLVDQRRWDEIVKVECELYQEIKSAVNDPKRSSAELLAELGTIVRLYKEISILCHSKDDCHSS